MTSTASPAATPERQALVSSALAARLPAHAVLTAKEDLLPYECDGLSAYRQTPLVAALPATIAEAAEVLRVARETGTPVVARGSGTGLSGGALPLADGILLSLGKFNRILALDPLARTARAQPGVRNAQITEAAAPHGLYYAPDPSSQIACSIGGNVAENSGGVHCLKYGLTVHNIQKVRALTIEGDDVEFGCDALDAPGYDLLAVMTGSEGLLALLTEVTVKLLPKPQTARVVMASFANVESAGEAVAAVIGAGIVPAGLEMMDKLATAAVEDYVHAGYDLEAEAILLCESDGTPEEVAEEIAKIEDVMREAGSTGFAVSGERGRAAEVLVRAQGGVPGRGPHLAGLLLHRRLHPARRGVEGAAAHRRALGALRPALRQRLPRGRRQPASAHPLRRQRARRVREDRGVRRRHPRALHRGGRHHHRRARRGRGEDQADVHPVPAGGARSSSTR